MLTDIKGFMTVSSNWVGESKDPLRAFVIPQMGIYSLASSRFSTKG